MKVLTFGGLAESKGEKFLFNGRPTPHKKSLKVFKFLFDIAKLSKLLSYQIIAKL